MIGDKRGVTLMELLVVLGLFSMAVTLSSAIFLQANKVQRRVLSIANAQADMRFALELMVREIRTGKVDYASYATGGGVSIPSPRLLVVNADGNKEEFYLETSPAVCTLPSTRCLAVKLNGGAAQPVTSSGVDVERLAFYVTPQVDPFNPDEATGLYGADQQPIVTFMMRVKNAGMSPSDTATFDAQTSVTSRSYVR